LNPPEASATIGARLLGLARLLRRRFIVVALVIVVAVGVAGAGSAATDTVWQAEARVRLLPRPDDRLFGSTPVSAIQDRDLQNAVEEATGDAVAGVVLAAPGRSVDISAVPIAGTDVIALRATSEDPERAQTVVDAWADALIDHRRVQATDELDQQAAALRLRIDELQGGGGVVDATDPLATQLATLRERLDQVSVARNAQTGDARVLASSTGVGNRTDPTLTLILALTLGLAAGVGLAVVVDSVAAARASLPGPRRRRRRKPEPEPSPEPELELEPEPEPDPSDVDLVPTPAREHESASELDLDADLEPQPEPEPEPEPDRQPEQRPA
jgi:uncharacterized protein involved in exopolysaccharide biosynthesis